MSLSPALAASRLLADLPRLVAAKKEAGQLSYAQAAGQIGISKPALHAILANGAEPGLAHIKAMVSWLIPESPASGEIELTPSAQRVLDLLHERDGLGPAWLRKERGRLRGLFVPDVAGTLGELSHAGSFTQRTIDELLHTCITLGTVARMPPYRGPRNRDRADLGWPIELIRSSP